MRLPPVTGGGGFGRRASIRPVLRARTVTAREAAVSSLILVVFGPLCGCAWTLEISNFPADLRGEKQSYRAFASAKWLKMSDQETEGKEKI